MNTEQALKDVDAWLSEQGKLEVSHDKDKQPVISPHLRRCIDRLLHVALDKTDPIGDNDARTIGDTVVYLDGGGNEMTPELAVARTTRQDYDARHPGYLDQPTRAARVLTRQEWADEQDAERQAREGWRV